MTETRDHSKPCEHYTSRPHSENIYVNLGAVEGGAYLEGGVWLCGVDGCPGGQAK